MRRREFVVLLSCSAALRPLVARGEQQAMSVIGFLGSASAGPYARYLAAFRQGVAETGFVEGQNLQIEYRWAEDDYAHLPALAMDLVRRGVDLIVTSGGDISAIAAKNATSSIPIVSLLGGNPVKRGLIASFAAPAGNITGVAFMSTELMGKRLDVILGLVPGAKAVGYLVNAARRGAENNIRELREAARAKRVQVRILQASNASEIEAAFAALDKSHIDALLAADPFLLTQRKRLVTLVARYAVPTIYDWRDYVAEGGLISDGPDLASSYRQAGIYAGRILQGAKPADLPVEQPTKFELVINLKTAKLLGLTIPPLLLAQADEVIE